MLSLIKLILKSEKEFLFKDDEFLKKFDARTEAHNLLSDELQKSNIDIQLLKNLISSIENLNDYYLKKMSETYTRKYTKI